MITSPPFVHVLKHLSLRSLGDGCPFAGLDTFVAMCATLSNAAHPDSRLVGPGGPSLPVGLSTLTVSPLSSAVIDTRVVAVLRDLQNQHLRNTVSREAMRKRDSKPEREACQPVAECPTYSTGEATQMEDDFRNTNDWLTARLESQAMAEMRMRPAFYFEGGHDLNGLTQQLHNAHLFRPLLRLHAEIPHHYPSVDAVFLALKRGVALEGRLPLVLSGQALVSMNHALLCELLLRPQPGPVVVETLWLTGTSLGETSLVGATRGGGDISLPKLFRAALTGLVADRLSDRPATVKITEDFREACYSFMDELQLMEEDMPGIAAALRQLAPTLMFGFAVMFALHRTERAVDQPPEVFTGLSRALAERMVAYRQEAVTGGHRERIEQLGRRVVDRLSDGPLTEREITRRVYKLPMPQCRLVMASLESCGAVRRVGQQWHLVGSPAAANLEAEATDVTP
ncbi:MAG: hypothetical protein RLZZ505_2758 [Verrucomicrobiota bacterium]|jgi:hypothetical protein